MTTYTAANIRILDRDEIVERFEWAKIAELADRYGRSEDWIRRGLQACREAGVDERYFVDRYLEHKPYVPEHEGVTEAFKNLTWPERKPI